MFAPALLDTLVAVLETGSFDRAADRLNVTPPAVSQRMRVLAEAAGGPVLSRMRPAEPTPLGRRLLRHARDVAALQADLSRDLGAPGGPRPVSVAVNADSLEGWATPALAACAGFRFDVVIADQDVTADLLRRGEVSAAVTALGDAVPGCTSRRLGVLRYRATCAPGFRDWHLGGGVTAAALSDAPMLQFDAQDALQHRWAARHVPGATLPPAHRLPAPGPFVQAARAGLGWGLNPEGLVAADMSRGTLVELLPGTPLDLMLHWQVSRTMAATLAPVSRAVAAAARNALIPG